MVNILDKFYMICIARKREKIYKRVMLDIWGNYAAKSVYKKGDRIIQFFGKIRRLRRAR